MLTKMEKNTSNNMNAKTAEKGERKKKENEWRKGKKKWYKEWTIGKEKKNNFQNVLEGRRFKLLFTPLSW